MIQHSRVLWSILMFIIFRWIFARCSLTRRWTQFGHNCCAIQNMDRLNGLFGFSHHTQSLQVHQPPLLAIPPRPTLAWFLKSRVPKSKTVTFLSTLRYVENYFIIYSNRKKPSPLNYLMAKISIYSRAFCGYYRAWSLLRQLDCAATNRLEYVLGIRFAICMLYFKSRIE